MAQRLVIKEQDSYLAFIESVIYTHINVNKTFSSMRCFFNGTYRQQSFISSPSVALSSIPYFVIKSLKVSRFVYYFVMALLTDEVYFVGSIIL